MLFAQTKQILSPAPEFVPDTTFTGSALTGWQPLGDATWRATNGEIVGTPSSPGGGWLVLNRSYQDVQFFSRVKCDGPLHHGPLAPDAEDTGRHERDFRLAQGR